MIRKNYMKMLYQMHLARIHTDQLHTQHFFPFFLFFTYLHVITGIMKVKLKVNSSEAFRQVFVMKLKFKNIFL